MTGRWPRVATVEAESLVEGDTIPAPESFIPSLLESGLKADIFTFTQKLPDTTPRHKYHLEWSNIAAIPITTFSDWLTNRAEHDVRSALKKAARLGLIAKVAECNDTFVHGVKSIYDETPVRQGKPFWHYLKDFEQVKSEISTYPERSAFVGAYWEEELIGFLKLVFLDKAEAVILQVISKQQHSNKKPTNALIAKAVEICVQRGVSYLTYGSYAYRDENNSLTEFKRRNGFEKILLPKYYIPLNTAGRVALRLGLHHQVADWLPKPVLAKLRGIRGLWYARKAGSAQQPS